MASPAIHAEGLRKSCGHVHALAGIDLSVPEGTVLGLLGPNGAGKTSHDVVGRNARARGDGEPPVGGLDDGPYSLTASGPSGTSMVTRPASTATG